MLHSPDATLLMLCSGKRIRPPRYRIRLQHYHVALDRCNITHVVLGNNPSTTPSHVCNMSHVAIAGCNMTHVVLACCNITHVVLGGGGCGPSTTPSQVCNMSQVALASCNMIHVVLGGRPAPCLEHEPCCTCRLQHETCYTQGKVDPCLEHEPCCACRCNMTHLAFRKTFACCAWEEVVLRAI